MQPKVCPVCGTSPVEPLRGSVRATATIQDDGHSRDFPAMTAWRCAQHGHVFFLASEASESEH